MIRMDPNRLATFLENVIVVGEAVKAHPRTDPSSINVVWRSDLASATSKANSSIRYEVITEGTRRADEAMSLLAKEAAELLSELPG